MKGGVRNLTVAVLSAIFLLAGILGVREAAAAGYTDVTKALLNRDAYVAPVVIQHHVAASGDEQRLEAAAQKAAASGVPEKYALVGSYPPKYADAYAAARGLRQFLNFSGVLVLVSPRGIGVSSDRLTLSEVQTAEHKAAARCLTSFTTCALIAGDEAQTLIRSDQSTSNRNSSIFWLVIVGVILLVLLFAVVGGVRRRRAAAGRLEELRQAANNTLSLADNAVQEIESSATKMPTDVRNDYDRALGLRDTARTELDRATTPEMLSQANQDAAQAVLGMQGVMRRLGMQTALAGPLDTPGHRCFYCGRDDRPPYTQQTISDKQGNSMEVDVCSHCEAELQRGRTPQVATVNYGGSALPWWAVPGNPWYYAYGGPTWQYWLPFFIGMDVGGWFGGGWGAPYGDWDSGQGWGAGAGDSGQLAGSTVDPSTDYGAGDFGGWGGDSGGWGGDSGGGDWGGGGGDWGGGDSGGGDWGGGGGGDWG